jgi:16S rRNA A1518/A1519 N6-dimethyltransferase RsmA/KsgA/DIM1 with predicted DNA glycosylase/AP lyase activity
MMTKFSRCIHSVDKIVRYAGDLSSKTVLEVGPGPGSLTRSILKAGARRLIVVEKDRRFLPALEMLQSAAGNVAEIEEDEQNEEEEVEVEVEEDVVMTKDKTKDKRKESTMKNKNKNKKKRKKRKSTTTATTTKTNTSRYSHSWTLSARMQIVMEDVLQLDEEQVLKPFHKPTTKWTSSTLAPITVIGNLPFSISTELLLKWIRHIPTRQGLFRFGRVPFILTFQKEVAEVNYICFHSLSLSPLLSVSLNTPTPTHTHTH